MVDIVAALEALPAGSFREYKRKHIGYAFRQFRKDSKCPKDASYYFVLGDDGEAPEPGGSTSTGRIVVCHPVAGRMIYKHSDFFERFTIAESTSTAYPKRESVFAFVPSAAFLDRLGGDRAFSNFWGRVDTVTADTVVVRHGPGQYYVKDKKAFLALYTHDTRVRSVATSAAGKTSSQARLSTKTRPEESFQPAAPTPPGRPESPALTSSRRRSLRRASRRNP